MKKLLALLVLGSALSAGCAPGAPSASAPQPDGAQAERVFEMRTYTAPPGRLDALHQRFRDHTMRLFAKHGMTNVGYWVPQADEGSPHTLVYLLAHRSREAARRSWRAFGADPEWHAVRDASEADGPIVQKVESVFLDPTDYSPLR